jgi:hypothetical protein
MSDIARERGHVPASEQAQPGAQGDSKVASHQITDFGDAEGSEEDEEEDGQAKGVPAAAAAAAGAVGDAGEEIDLGVRVSAAADAGVVAVGKGGAEAQVVSLHLEPDEAAGCVQVHLLVL